MTAPRRTVAFLIALASLLALTSLPRPAEAVTPTIRAIHFPVEGPVRFREDSAIRGSRTVTRATT